VRSFLDNLSKENKALQESNASLEITARDALAAKAYVEQHRNQLESALVASKEQVGVMPDSYVQEARYVIRPYLCRLRASWRPAARSGTAWRTATTAS
jgi:hypothetical protein